MTNEQAHKIAELAVEYVQCLQDWHWLSMKQRSMNHETSSLRHMQVMSQKEAAERALMLGIHLELCDAVMGVSCGE